MSWNGRTLPFLPAHRFRSCSFGGWRCISLDCLALMAKETWKLTCHFLPKAKSVVATSPEKDSIQNEDWHYSTDIIEPKPVQHLTHKLIGCTHFPLIKKPFDDDTCLLRGRRWGSNVGWSACSADHAGRTPSANATRCRRKQRNTGRQDCWPGRSQIYRRELFDA